MSETTIGGYFWACDDCAHERENGECDPDRPDDLPEPWALWGGQMDKVANACGGDDDYEETHLDFTWSACEACGANLGGSRHRYAWFTA